MSTNPVARILSDERFPASWFTADHVHGDVVEWEPIDNQVPMFSTGEQVALRFCKALDDLWRATDPHLRQLCIDAMQASLNAEE